MKDARDIDIQVGDTVTFAQQYFSERYGWSSMGWGTVTKIMNRQIAIDCGNTVLKKAGHNTIVCNLPNQTDQHKYNVTQSA